ncbi:MAG: hypothetical protein ACUVX8_15845 [Candidatus Zipacnadales bacterium]
MTALTRSEIEQATRKLQAIIDEVCGTCKMNCCLQGTMVGRDDARRIAKAARLSSLFRERLMQGLKARSAQLRKDLEGLQRAAKLIRTRFSADRQAAIGALELTLKRWAEFCDFLEHEFDASLDHLLRCLQFSAIRAGALRAMRAFPGGERVLPALAGQDTSFQSGRRGVKAAPCLFHVNGCIIPTAKPHKCADFYCSSDPGLVNEVVDRLSFDEFIVAHFMPYNCAQLLEDLKTEVNLGRDFWEPKVIIGGGRDLVATISNLLRDIFEQVTVKRLEGSHLSIAVDLPDVTQQQENEALVLYCGSLDALSIYELAVTLVRARSNSLRPAIVVIADELTRQAGGEHPLWTERAIAQPLSALNLIAIVGS